MPRRLPRGEACGLLKVRWPLHVLRGALNVSMLALFSYALKKLDLAEASTVFFHWAATHHGTVHRAPG